MTPLDLQLRAFFRSYIKAFDTFDAVAIASHFYLPSSIITNTQAIVFTDVGDTVDSFQRILDQHKYIGYHHAKILKITRTILSEQLTQTKITWSFRKSDNSVISDFDTFYILANYDQNPNDPLKITTVIVP